MPKINQEEYEVLKELADKWKWIARDDDLSVYDDKPVKVHSVIPCWDIRTTKSEWSVLNSDLFQFIQWENENPYNIAELIEEYEEHEFYDYVGWEYYESEETEVKKDIEWLKKEVPNLRGYAVVVDEIDGGLKPVTTISVKDVCKLINQLDEPEVTHEQVVEWIENNEFYCHATAETVLENAVDKGELGYYGTKYSVVEKPVIPKFVAKYLDFAKSDTTLMRVLELANTRNEWEKWEKEYDWIEENHELFARAWLDGYEVEKEQKYYARIKGWENVTTGSERFNWVYFKEKDTIGISKAVENKYQAASFTKDDWDNLGINEHNADFVLAEELEE